MSANLFVWRRGVKEKQSSFHMYGLIDQYGLGLNANDCQYIVYLFSLAGVDVFLLSLSISPGGAFDPTPAFALATLEVLT